MKISTLFFEFYLQEASHQLPELIQEIRKVFEILADAPLLFRAVDEQHRRALILKYRLSLYFIIDESINTVVIQSVVHDSRHPDTWKLKDRNKKL